MPPRVVDTVGAGDVFNAGMVHALAMGADTPRALEIATRLAGRKVDQTGCHECPSAPQSCRSTEIIG